ncbi:hypothetical protein COL52_19825, partial [Bacillus toyonensis]
SKKIEARQGLFDMPTFIKFIKDNKKLYGKNAFCIKIYLKLMDVWRDPYKKSQCAIQSFVLLFLAK